MSGTRESRVVEVQMDDDSYQRAEVVEAGERPGWLRCRLSDGLTWWAAPNEWREPAR